MFKRYFAALILFLVTAVSAQNFTIVVPTAPGSFHDIAARSVASSISEKVGLPVVMEYKVGAHGLIAVQHFMSLPKDGNSAIIGSTVIPFVAKAHPDQATDVIKEITPVHGVSRVDIVLLVPSSSNIYTVGDLVKKYKSGNALLAGTAAPQSDFLLQELSKSIGISTELIRYKQVGPMFIDLTNGAFDFVASAANGTALKSMIDSKKLRPIAILGSKPSALFPEVPTLKSMGYAPVDDFAWSAIFMHDKVQSERKEKVADAVKVALKNYNGLSYDISSKAISTQVQREYELMKLK